MPIKISDLYTKIDVEPYGIIELLGLVIKDIDWLGDPETKALPAREFVVCLIQNHLISPTLDFETVSGWSDNLLAFVANGWLKDQRQQSDDTSQSSFEEFKQAVYAYKDEQFRETRELFDTFATNLKDIMTPILPDIIGINSSFTQVADLASGFMNQTSVISQLANEWRSQAAGLMTSVESLYKNVFASTELINNAITCLAEMPKIEFTVPKLVTQKIFEGLPDFTEWEAISKEIRESNQAFLQSGYGFINHLVSYETVRRFASINAQVRNAAFTNSIAATTRHKNFEEQLHQLFQKSSVLRRRWKIVAQAICAHRRREYHISVPALLAQVEGIIGDALILKKLVHREGNQLYLKENGKLKRGKNGDRVKATGLDSLIRHSKWKDDAVLNGVADLITTQLAGERNGIMHGRRIDYGTAKLSVQGLLLLSVLATMFVDLENGRA